MINEVFKGQYLSSADYFKAKRWEGRSLGFKLKYFIANHPEMSFGCFIFAVIAPVICAYKTMNYNTNKYKALEKYRMHYTVVRDDHPNIEEIKAQKEFGREHFPQF